jgi:hypothetical protein
LYLFEIDDTWDDLFKDLLEESEFKIHKTDKVSVTISDKLMGTTVFTPENVQTGKVQIRIYRKCKTENIFVGHNCNNKKWVGPNFGGSVGQQQTKPFLFLAQIVLPRVVTPFIRP